MVLAGVDNCKEKQVGIAVKSQTLLSRGPAVTFITPEIQGDLRCLLCH